MPIREFQPDDYPAVRALWEHLAMYRPAMDTPAMLAGCVARNPGLFLLAPDPAAPARIVGTVIGTFDGRRAYLYHVAVHPDYRRHGYGRALVRAVLDRLWAAGAPKVTLRVAAANAGAIAFYQSLGLLPDAAVLGMSVERGL
ncbi:MAG: GNAT family N-acetyltransferase [Chloroflexota bacterium]|nr:GNAT family N-acetyltransferase [Chloroflexota bacterium]